MATDLAFVLSQDVQGSGFRVKGLSREVFGVVMRVKLGE